jgi:hypothetical protein
LDYGSQSERKQKVFRCIVIENERLGHNKATKDEAGDEQRIPSLPPILLAALMFIFTAF